MIAVLYVLFFAFYLLTSVWVVRAGYRFAKSRYGRGWVGGGLAALVMYNLVFWDWIPVWLMHRYYCATQAGFWVYKTPEQWVKEHPEVVGQDWTDQSKWRYETLDDGASRSWPSPFIYVQYSTRANAFHAVAIKTTKIVDATTGRDLCLSKEYYRDNRGALAMGARSLTDYKIWLGEGKRVCGPDNGAGHTYALYKYLDEVFRLISK